MHGLLLFNKPRGWRNRDIITFFRRLSGQQRVGHGGTLDPTAEGLLVIGLGRTATRALAPFLNHSQKTYHATLRLGARSTTGDAEGEITEASTVARPTREQLPAALVALTLKRQQIEATMNEQFAGEHLQQPPVYSALKVRGQRARDRAARGEVVELAPRLVRLEAWKLLRYDYFELGLELTVSSGFYVRSLAMELGEALGTGAYLTALTRTKIVCEGTTYDLDRALTPENFDSPMELTGTITGTVQGVGFREYIRRQAEQLGLNGWARNEKNNEVAICAQGQKTELEQFQSLIEQGPGQIERIDYLWQRPAEIFSDFIIR